MPVRVKDNGANALLRRIKAKRKVKVGIIGDEAAAAKSGDALGELTDNTVVEVATKHEFGIGVPERSFIRGYMDEHAGQLRVASRKLGKAVLKGTMTMDQALEKMGLYMVGEIVERINRGIPPENSEWWKEQKQANGGSTTALVNTGQMKSSITHEVVGG